MVQELGSVIAVLGILVTFVAYFGQHSRVSLRDLEPGLVSRWNRGRGWVLHKLGRGKNINVQVDSAMVVLSAITPTGLRWQPIQPGDDIAVRVEKLRQNLDALRANLAEMRELDQKQFREVTDRLDKQVAELTQRFAASQQEDQQADTTAMRWEVRGLFITLVGAVMTLFG